LSRLTHRIVNNRSASGGFFVDIMKIQKVKINHKMKNLKFQTIFEYMTTVLDQPQQGWSSLCKNGSYCYKKSAHGGF
jgi:hypothetical protein